MAEPQGKKTAGKKTPAKTRTTTVRTPPKAAPKASPSRQKLTESERRRMIEVAAYFIAKNDGNRRPPESYWADGEKEIERMLQKQG